jgi:hypothetical protein
MSQGRAYFLLRPLVMLGDGETQRVLVKFPRGRGVVPMQRAFRQQHRDDHPVRLGAQRRLQVGLGLGKTARIEKRLAEAEERQLVTRPLQQQSLVAGDEDVVGHAGTYSVRGG